MAVNSRTNRREMAYYPAKASAGSRRRDLEGSLRSAVGARSAARRERAAAQTNPLAAFFGTIGAGIADFFYLLGAVLGYLRVAVFLRPERRLYWGLKKLGIRLRYAARHMWDVLSAPFVKAVSGCRAMHRVWSGRRGERFGVRVMAVADAFYLGCRNNTRVFKTIANYLLPVMSVALFLCVISMAGKMSFAVSVSYHGEQLGYVQSEAVAEQAKQIVTGRLVYLSDSERVTIEPAYSLEIIDNDSMMNEYQLADKLITYSGGELVTAKGLYVNDVFYGACEGEGNEIEAALQEVLDSQRSDGESETVSFVDDVQVVPGVYLSDNLIPAEDMVAQIKSTDSSSHFYTAAAGDTAGTVADASNISLEALQALNPELGIESRETAFSAGQQLVVSEQDTFLPVQVTRLETYTEEVPFQTETTKSANYVKGTVKTVTAGVNGENEVTAKVSYVDGDEVAREVLSSRVVKEPVTEKLVQGTATPVSLSGSTGSGKINSGFIWPLSGNYYVSSDFGWRSLGNHGGIDICLRGGTYGASVMACAPGTVIYSGWSGTYGKLVKIDHGNGLQTYYAHNSQLLVSAGDYVGQGEVIAKAGSTGRVTGPHVHLEVRVNGVRQNPMRYLP